LPFGVPLVCLDNVTPVGEVNLRHGWRALYPADVNPYMICRKYTALRAGRRTKAMSDTPEMMEGAPLIRPSSTAHPLYDTIVEACRSVYDPEIPVNIFDLGLVYTIDIAPDNAVNIIMTLTAPGCPVAGEMPGWVADAVEPLEGVKQVDVEITWDPPWGMDMMSDEARLELGFM
jgi:FeS assembly SUF system protein